MHTKPIHAEDTVPYINNYQHTIPRLGLHANAPDQSVPIPCPLVPPYSIFAHRGDFRTAQIR